MRNASISLRLTLWFSGIFLLGFVLFGVAMWLDLAYSLSSGRDRTFARRSTRLVDLLEENRNNDHARQLAKLDSFTEGTPEGNLIQICDLHGVRVYPPVLRPPDFPWPEPVRDETDRHVNLMYAGQHYRVLIRNVRVNSQPLTILVGGRMEDNRQLLGRFSAGLVAAAPVLLLLSALFGYFLSRRALRPVDRLTAAARTISIGNLSDRLPIHPTGDELQRLAETCNAMLERLDSAVNRINRFTADASHELRTPISFIRTRAEFALLDADLDPENRQTYKDILDESEEATRLLEDMLTLARADAGCAEVVFEAVDLSVLVDEVFEKARPFAAGKRQTLARAGCIACPIEVRGDRSYLRRLIWTLIDNAVKYTREGGTIEVGVAPQQETAQVTVRDNGIGMAREMLPHIFDRFFRADPARGHSEGTGLGLAIAKWIAGIHHADLSVDSTLGSGTVFTVTLPLARQANAK